MAKPGRPKGLHDSQNHTFIGKYAINQSKFFSRMITDDNGCHVWTAGKHRQGYGMFSVYNTEINDRQMTVAHRVAMILHLGRDLGRDEFVIHEHCDNFLCCNPAHLTLGDAAKRNEVQYTKGHYPSKGKGPNAVKKQNRPYKYTEDQMRDFRDMTTKESSEKYGITRRSASCLKHRFKTGYKWLG